mmetsp:Transcript_1101/g.1279  ORF Transcript_1101/g.1279 Transcript_1101/m.1279 type:complete len:779 (-) Transcript_1101:613-2949(-)
MGIRPSWGSMDEILEYQAIKQKYNDRRSRKHVSTDHRTSAWKKLFSGERNDLVGASENAVSGFDVNADAVGEVDKNAIYREHLEHVLECVFEKRNDYQVLFTNDEKKIVQTLLKDVSPSSRGLFARLFQRKGPWFRVQLLSSYFQTGTEEGHGDSIDALQKAIDELALGGFLHKFTSSVKDLDGALSVISTTLNAGEVKEIVKMLKLPRTNKYKKQDCIQAIRARCKSQRTLFGQSIPLVGMIGKVLDGELISLPEKVQFVVSRAFSLFYLSDSTFVQQLDQTNTTKSTWLLVKFKKLRFHPYEFKSPSPPVFASRAQLECFANAQYIYEKISCWEPGSNDVVALSQNSPSLFNLNPAIIDRFFDPESVDIISVVESIARYITEYFESTLNQDTSQHPTLYRTFTGGKVLCAALSLGVHELEKLRLYELAAKYLLQLLHFQPQARERGRWWNRLSIDYKHLQRLDNACNACISCIEDKAIFPDSAHRSEAFRRLEKLSNQSSLSSHIREQAASIMPARPPQADIPCEQIFGRRKNRAKSKKCDFLSMGDSNDKLYCSVEGYVLEHYETLGGWSGLHCEGSMFRTLFTLFFWDVIFREDIPNVFHSPYQAAPLDLYFCNGLFYESRKNQIDSLLEEISNMTRHQIAATLRQNWDLHNGIRAAGISWDRFNLDTIQCVGVCMGPKVLSKVFERLCQDYAHWGGGVPDLLLYRISHPNSSVIIEYPENMEFKDTWEYDVEFVEVKSKDDSLFEKQRCWLDFLLSIGAKARICKVTNKVDSA